MIRISNIVNHNGNASANQFVVITSNGSYYQSYDEVIAVKNKDGVFITQKWDSSKTTAKHLYIFLTKHVFGYEIDKQTVLNHLQQGYIKYASGTIEIE